MKHFQPAEHISIDERMVQNKWIYGFRQYSVSDFVTDHCALHESLVCMHSHMKLKQITFRPLKTLNMI